MIRCTDIIILILRIYCSLSEWCCLYCICKGKEYVFCLQQSAQCIGAYRCRCCQTDSSYVGNYGCYGSTISGSLTDHYDPGSKKLALSQDVYDKTSVAAIGVAAHECGHAIQHATNYVPLNLRSAIVPVANIGSTLSWPLFLAGLIFSIRPLLTVGIILFTFAVLFQLVTLPVEFNASSRALKMLGSSGMLGADEVKGARKVLTAAALTYVAALASSILQLLRLIILAGGRDRD